jgi:hypothetical protein
MPGRSASAAISALDLGGVALPQKTKVGTGGRSNKARNAPRSETGSSWPVTNATDAKRAPGRRAMSCFLAMKTGVIRLASA